MADALFVRHDHRVAGAGCVPASVLGSRHPRRDVVALDAAADRR
jgi:hypothetical protein